MDVSLFLYFCGFFFLFRICNLIFVEIVTFYSPVLRIILLLSLIASIYILLTYIYVNRRLQRYLSFITVFLRIYYRIILSDFFPFHQYSVFVLLRATPFFQLSKLASNFPPKVFSPGPNPSIHPDMSEGKSQPPSTFLGRGVIIFRILGPRGVRPQSPFLIYQQFGKRGTIDCIK